MSSAWRPILRHDDVVRDVVTLERPERQGDVVRVVFDNRIFPGFTEPHKVK